MKDCIFCKIARREIESNILYENNNFFSIFDINPITEGHALVISKKHFENIFDMPGSLGIELLDCIKKTSMKIINEKKSEGINVLNNNFLAAGQLVNHIHFHIVPRKKDDGIKVLE